MAHSHNPFRKITTTWAYNKHKNDNFFQWAIFLRSRGEKHDNGKDNRCLSATCQEYAAALLWDMESMGSDLTKRSESRIIISLTIR